MDRYGSSHSTEGCDAYNADDYCVYYCQIFSVSIQFSGECWSVSRTRIKFVYLSLRPSHVPDLVISLGIVLIGLHQLRDSALYFSPSVLPLHISVVCARACVCVWMHTCMYVMYVTYACMHVSRLCVCIIHTRAHKRTYIRIWRGAV